MSRVGNNPITIPEGVSVEISESKIIVKGKLGEIEQEFSSDMNNFTFLKKKPQLRILKNKELISKNFLAI